MVRFPWSHRAATTGGVYTTLGNSDLQVSHICFGTYRLQGKCDIRSAMDLFKQAYERGINFFDTADIYGVAESFLGIAIRDHVLPRNKVVIATKAGLAATEEDERSFNERGIKVDTSPKRLRQQVDKSLLALGIDSIDLYQTHSFDPNTRLDEVIDTMDRLIKEGKIRHYGFSNYTEAQSIQRAVLICRAYDKRPPISLQNLYNLLSGNNQVLRKAQEYGMSVLPYSPLNQGLLTDRHFMTERSIPKVPEESLTPEIIGQIKSAKIMNELRRLHLMAQNDYGRNIQQLAVAWLLDQGMIPIVGAYKSQHLEEAVRAMDWKLEEAIKERIDETRAEIFDIIKQDN